MKNLDRKQNKNQTFETGQLPGGVFWITLTQIKSQQPCYSPIICLKHILRTNTH